MEIVEPGARQRSGSCAILRIGDRSNTGHDQTCIGPEQFVSASHEAFTRTNSTPRGAPMVSERLAETTPARKATCRTIGNGILNESPVHSISQFKLRPNPLKLKTIKTIDSE
ncbi:hypothetical protein [Burkholderia catarinensis]|uniref:hypothetical protein n=1 Tax=Burkholderia catarinensis TaxID=1108140 RepID=UPI001C57EA26|nr:hypothetical protein [Burkholderia catarinensis]